MPSLSRIVDVRKGETSTALLMFAYAYLAMTAYNIIQPLTRSKLIASLGAVNVPWVIFGSGLFIGVLMLGYTRVVSMLPRRWALPITQAGMAAMMVVFWALFRSAGDWVSVAFYVWGGILGILLISQFWTLANGIYDPRQAKRLFGFIGGGVMLGGMTGALLTATIIETVGANALLLWSAGTLLASMAIVSIILGRETSAAESRSRKRRGTRRQPGTRLHAAPRVASDSAHRGGHQFRVPRRVAARPAGEHGRRGLQGRRAGRLDRRLPGADPFLHLARGVRHPGLDHAAHSPVPGHRVRPPHSPDQSRRHRRPRPDEQGPLGPGRRARDGPVHPVHRRQDDPRSAVPPAPVGAAAGSQTVCRRHRRSPVARHRRLADARADPAVGLRARVVSAQLRQCRPGHRSGTSSRLAPSAAT